MTAASIVKPRHSLALTSLSLGIALASSISSAAEPQVAVFDPILVTATLSEVTQRDAPAASSVISQQEIAELSGQDISELLSQTTGISLSGRGVGNRKVINLRGMESHHTLIMIDGRRISASDAVVGHSDFQNSWIGKDAIERIEVVRGPLSSLYGSEGMGGVINIITKKPTKAWTGSLKLNAGTPKREGQELDLALGLSGQLTDKLGVRLNTSIAEHDKTELKSNPALSETEGKDSSALAVSLQYQISEQHSVELYLNRINEQRARDTLSRARVQHESRYDIERSMISLAYTGEFETTQLSAKVYRSGIEIKNKTTQGVAPTAPQELTDSVVEAHLSHQLSSAQLLTVGGEYRVEELQHNMLVGDRDEVSNRALFLQDEISLSDNLNLTLGARLDDHQIFGSEWSPRAYLVYSLSPQWRIKSGYGEGFRAPTLKQISPNYRFVGFHSFIGNPSLQPETSQTVELALQYYGDTVTGGVTLYRNEVEGLIQTQCIENCSGRFGRVFKYVNVDQAQIQGLELDLAIDLSPAWQLSVNASALDTENKTTGQELSNRPELSANAKLQWQPSDSGWKMTLRSQYIGAQMDDSKQLPEYQLWHISASKNLGANTKLRFGIDNLSDTYLADKDPDFSFEERGRFVYLGAELTF